MKIRPATHGPLEATARRRNAVVMLTIVATIAGLAASAVQVYQFCFEANAPAPASTIVIASAPAEAEPRGATAPVSGSWNLRTTVERTSYRPFEGLVCVYRINLIEAPSGEVSGTGELWSENGTEVTGANHLLMQLSGHYDGFTLRLTYQLEGRSRTSTGGIALAFDEETMSWSGRFDSGVAAAEGGARLEPR
jgi:hypothetical protein